MTPRTSRLAIWSLVCGILGLLVSLACLGPLFAIPAVICGHMGYSRIGRAPEELSGQGMALGGLITGYITIAASVVLIPLLVAIAIPNFVKARQVAQQNACINNLRQIEGAKAQCSLERELSEGEVITSTDLDVYLKNGFSSVNCPARGSYSINPLGEPPTCSIHSHLLPEY